MALNMAVLNSLSDKDNSKPKTNLRKSEAVKNAVRAPPSPRPGGGGGTGDESLKPAAYKKPPPKEGGEEEKAGDTGIQRRATQKGFDKDGNRIKQRFVDGWWFNGTVMIGICINAIQMGLELELEGGAWEIVWKGLEYFFTVFFFIEMCMKFVLCGPKEYFSSKANWLDFIVVVFAVLDNFIFSLIMDQGEGEFGFISILRLVRLGRILKLLRAKKELMMLIEGILSSLRSMVWLSIMLIILMYTVSIVFVKFIGKTDVYKDHYFDNELYFKNMSTSMVTAFNLALRVDWNKVFRPVLEQQPILALAILVYFGVSCFGVMNAIIGVIVSRTQSAAKEAEDIEENNYREQQMILIENVKDIIYEIDEDGDGTVSPEEIAMAGDNEQLISALESVDLPAGFSMLELHCMLDKDGDGELAAGEFTLGMRRLIFSNDFQRQCLLMLGISQQKRKIYEQKQFIEEQFEEHTKNMDKQFAKLDQKIDDLPRKIASMLGSSFDPRDFGGGDSPTMGNTISMDTTNSMGNQRLLTPPGAPSTNPDSFDFRTPWSATKPKKLLGVSMNAAEQALQEANQLRYDDDYDNFAVAECANISVPIGQHPVKTYAQAMPLLPGIVGQQQGITPIPGNEKNRNVRMPESSLRAGAAGESANQLVTQLPGTPEVNHLQNQQIGNLPGTPESQNQAAPPNISQQMVTTAPANLNGNATSQVQQMATTAPTPMQSNQSSSLLSPSSANAANGKPKAKANGWIRPESSVKECIV